MMGTDPERARAIGVPQGLVDAVGAAGFDPARPAVQAAVSFLRPTDPRRLLVIAGPVGTGKSLAAAHAVFGARKADRTEQVLIDGEPTPVVLAGGLVAARWTHARQFFHGVYEAEFWAGLQRIPVLVVDDLGSEPADGRVTPLVASLLCERVDDGRKTIVTANMDPASFRGRYGDRVLDRMTGGAWHGTRGPSLRGGRA